MFLSDLLQAIGYLLDVKWIHEGKVYTGSFCAAQGGYEFYETWTCNQLTCYRHHPADGGDRCGHGDSGNVFHRISYFFNPHLPGFYCKVISIHTFIGLFWSVGIQGRAARLTAFGIVTCIWLFVIVFCALGAGIHHTSGDLYEVSFPCCPSRNCTH